MSIQYLENNKIIFHDIETNLSNEGELINSTNLDFINKILKINTNEYDYIYKLNDNWAGKYLFVKGNAYRLVTCGSGKPIVYDESGILNNHIPSKKCEII